MKKVLVFGGFGFLGYYLLKELLSRDYKIVVADIKKDDEFNSFVEFIHCDISSQENVNDVFKKENFEITATSYFGIESDMDIGKVDANHLYEILSKLDLNGESAGCFAPFNPPLNSFSN